MRIRSHSTGTADNWNGFDDYDKSAPTSYAREETTTTTNHTTTTTSSSSSVRKQHKTETKSDFGALDVKATKAKSKASVEDDAWDLLNN